MPDVQPTAVADHGPVADACLILAAAPALADHVIATNQDHVVMFSITDDDVPFDLWGSGAQRMWLLLLATAHRAYTVSLYDVMASLDVPNRRAVANAIQALSW